MERKNIAVTAYFSEDGKVTPKSITWEDGRTFLIDRVIDTRRAASLKVGGIGCRFDCLIRGRRVYLFQDENSWFMESAECADDTKLTKRI